MIILVFTKQNIFPNFREYDADKINDVAARKPNTKLDPKEEVMTRNSPTNPDVPGNPEFAIKRKPL